MRMLVATLAAGLLAVSQSPSESTRIEQGTLRLHYVQKPIGVERYTVTREGDGLALASDFDFTDRGGRVQLMAVLHMKPDLTPISFRSKGKSYRFVNVDTDVRVEGNEAAVRDGP